MRKIFNIPPILNISFNLTNATNEILFHAGAGLKIQDPFIIKSLTTNTNYTVGAVGEIHQAVKNEYYYIKLNNRLEIGQYALYIVYVSQYSSLYGNRGMFAAKYLEDGVTK